jgi:hypothetical protein
MTAREPINFPALVVFSYCCPDLFPNWSKRKRATFGIPEHAKMQAFPTQSKGQQLFAAAPTAGS